MTENKTISKDTPIIELTLRKYEKPDQLEGRELVRKLCLSLGLLQPGDSRDVIVDILYVLIKSKKHLTAKEIEKLVIESRKKEKLKILGVASSNIRRQLKRLKDLLIVMNVQNKYFLTEDLKLIEIFEEKIENYLLNSIKSRVKEYIKKVDESF